MTTFYEIFFKIKENFLEMSGAPGQLVFSLLLVLPSAAAAEVMLGKHNSVKILHSSTLNCHSKYSSAKFFLNKTMQLLTETDGQHIMLLNRIRTQEK